MGTVYELMLLLQADALESARESLLKKTEETINLAKGKVRSSQPLGKKDLAYPIEREKEAYFYLFELEGPPNLIRTLDKKVKFQDGILRHLVVRKEE
jgi:small subunit ribosomal protein S6